MAFLQSKLKGAARSAGLWTGGLLVSCVGVAFLTVAAWLFLVSVSDALTAALVIGAAYLGLGLVLIGFAQSPDKPEPAPEPTPDSKTHVNANQPPLMQAFIYGMEAGSSWAKR